MSLGGYIFRKMCTKSDVKRDAGLEIPEDAEYIRDIRYGRNKKYHTLDICWPKDMKGKLPVIISVHGGGYVYGNKEVYQFYAASLAQRGFAVVNYNYRLAPKYKFPAPLEDLNAVIKWMLSNRDNYPIDLDRVFMVGDSAGAQIASQYAVIYSDRDYRNIMDFKKPKLKLRAVGLCCGCYDLKKRIINEGTRGVIKDYLTKNPSGFGEKLDILEHVTKDFPPAYIFTARGDFLKEDNEEMYKLLKSKGVKCEFKIYGKDKTGHVFHVNMRDEFSAEANDDQMEFFRRFC